MTWYVQILDQRVCNECLILESAGEPTYVCGRDSLCKVHGKVELLQLESTDSRERMTEREHKFVRSLWPSFQILSNLQTFPSTYLKSHKRDWNNLNFLRSVTSWRVTHLGDGNSQVGRKAILSKVVMRHCNHLLLISLSLSLLLLHRYPTHYKSSEIIYMIMGL